MKRPLFDIIKGDNKFKILIVDDKTDNIEVAASALAPEGFTLLFAQSGADCLRIAEKEQPDLILLDIMMPEMDGVETCRILKENPATAHIAVIFLTAKIDDETLSNSFAAGGDDYISKPFSSTSLLARVYNQLRIIYKREALIQAQERLANAEKDQLLGLLAGGIAHDFNNQLNGIMGFSDLIKDRTTDDKIIRLADLITECGERCATLTNNLLAFAGKGKYQMTQINISSLLKNTVGNVLSKYPHVQLVMNNVATSTTIVGDNTQISSVFEAVIINALEAMSKDSGGILTIDISDWDMVVPKVAHVVKHPGDSNFLEIKVSDTGIGISEEDIVHVFEPFFTTKDLSSGGGMSLAAANGIVDNHGGAIYIQSIEGKGTAVIILLPVDNNIQDSVVESKNKTFEDNSEQDCVLVIDDNKMSRILLEDIITNQSYKVFTASNGADGLDIFKQFKNKIKTVFLDYIMPQMSGEEVLRHLLELDDKARVYMISGYKSEQDVKELMDIGAKGFIKKPFKCQEILEII